MTGGASPWGGVNNAVYQHYLEHARHQFLRGHGFSFAELSQQGVDLVVVRAEVDYKAPLRSGDTFVVESQLTRESAVTFAFLQQIQRTTAGARAVVLRAKVVCAAMNKQGKPILPKVLAPMFAACEVHEPGGKR